MHTSDFLPYICTLIFVIFNLKQKKTKKTWSCGKKSLTYNGFNNEIINTISYYNNYNKYSFK